jgi:uncharacterized membrane protein YgcG
VRARALEVARVAAVLLVFVAAPTAGDIGSCGEAPQDLDAVKFFQAKELIDCQMCAECGMQTLACERACDFAPNQGSFPLGCYPLIHDGEVCLNALEVTGCDEYRLYMADNGATIPTECNFCPAKHEVDGGGGGGGSGGGSGSGGGIGDGSGNRSGEAP